LAAVEANSQESNKKNIIVLANALKALEPQMLRLNQIPVKKAKYKLAYYFS